MLPHQAAIAVAVPSRAGPTLEQRGRAAAARARALGCPAARAARAAGTARPASAAAAGAAPRAAPPALARVCAAAARPALARLARGALQRRLAGRLAFEGSYVLLRAPVLLLTNNTKENT